MTIMKDFLKNLIIVIFKLLNDEFIIKTSAYLFIFNIYWWQWIKKIKFTIKFTMNKKKKIKNKRKFTIKNVNFIINE